MHTHLFPLASNLASAPSSKREGGSSPSNLFPESSSVMSRDLSAPCMTGRDPEKRLFEASITTREERGSSEGRGPVNLLLLITITCREARVSREGRGPESLFLAVLRVTRAWAGAGRGPVNVFDEMSSSSRVLREEREGGSWPGGGRGSVVWVFVVVCIGCVLGVVVVSLVSQGWIMEVKR